MRAPIHDDTTIQHKDVVRLTNAADALGDGDRGAATPVQVADELLLSDGIECAGTAVQYDDPWIVNKRAGNAQPLLLST